MLTAPNAFKTVNLLECIYRQFFLFISFARLVNYVQIEEVVPSKSNTLNLLTGDQLKNVVNLINLICNQIKFIQVHILSLLSCRVEQI